jgi:hypothetical protein
MTIAVSRATNALSLDVDAPALDYLILVYGSDSGLLSLLLDAAKKAVGREDCPLCEITYGPTGKRSGWAACESRLGIPVKEMHRDQVPESWGLAVPDLPCVLSQNGGQPPTVLLTRAEIQGCRGSAVALEATVRRALQPRGQLVPAGAGERARG